MLERNMLTISAPDDVQRAESSLGTEGLPVRKISEYNPTFNSGGYFSDADKMTLTNFSRERWIANPDFSPRDTSQKSTFYTPIRNEPIVLVNHSMIETSKKLLN